VKKKIVFSIITGSVGIAIALLVAEILLRVLGISSEIAYLPNSNYGWSHAPGAQYSKVTEGERIPITINSFGLRDREFEYTKDAGTFRVLVLGDSFMEALQVATESTFAKQLEARLASSNAGEFSQIEVLNSGVSGFGTDNELLYFKAEGSGFGADLVLTALYVGNDIRNNWHELEIIDAGRHRKPYFTIEQGKLTLNANPNDVSGRFSTKAKIFLNRNSRLYAFARRLRDALSARARIAEQGMPLDWQIFATERPPSWGHAWQVTDKILLQLKDEVERSGASLLVMVIPTMFQVHDDYWTAPGGDQAWDLEMPNLMLHRILEKHDIDYVDLLPHFRANAAEDRKQLYLQNDAHWNESGHRIAADVVAAHLQESMTD